MFKSHEVTKKRRDSDNLQKRKPQYLIHKTFHILMYSLGSTRKELYTDFQGQEIFSSQTVSRENSSPGQ